MALSIDHFTAKTFEGTAGLTSFTSNPMDVAAGSVVEFIFASYKPSGTVLPTIASLTNNSGLTFTRKRGLSFSTSGGTSSSPQIRMESWFAVCPSNITGLTVTATMDNGGTNDRTVLILVEAKGVYSGAMFDPGASNVTRDNVLSTTAKQLGFTYLHSSQNTLDIEFAFLVNPTTAGTFDSGSQLLNSMSPSNSFRYVLAYRVGNGLANYALKFSRTDTLQGAIMGEVLNGDFPPSSSSRPVVIITQ